VYDVNLNVLSRLGAELNIAYSELFSRGEQRKPKVFVSHVWSHSLLQTYEALKQHAEDRGYGEGSGRRAPIGWPVQDWLRLGVVLPDSLRTARLGTPYDFDSSKSIEPAERATGDTSRHF
jgi:hypothetical protein